MSSPIRRSPQTLSLLSCLLERPTEWRYGYDLSRETDLKSGTLYPILMRLAERGWLEARWEDAEVEGRPRRHMYRLTGAGRQWARDEVGERKGATKLRPAFERGAL